MIAPLLIDMMRWSLCVCVFAITYDLAKANSQPVREPSGYVEMKKKHVPENSFGASCGASFAAETVLDNYWK